MVAGPVDAPKVCSHECAPRSRREKTLLICVLLVISEEILARSKRCGVDIYLANAVAQITEVRNGRKLRAFLKMRIALLAGRVRFV